jgi:L-ribulose-5-phosphate 4-epimerase
LGDPLPIADADIDRLYDRYQNVYGQPAADRPATAEQPADRPATDREATA